MSSLRTAALVLALVGSVTAAVTQPAAAEDDFFDWSCPALYEARNGIYKDGGYCFKTKKAIETFGNAGCQYDDINDVPLSANQRKVVNRIVAAEEAKSCRRR